MAKLSAEMIDPLGHICNCYTHLVTYITDLPKQQLIVCVAKNTSSMTIIILP